MPIQIDLSSSSSGAKSPKPNKSGPIVGIDLGTTHSLVAASVEKGTTKILFSEGEAPLFPSVVFVDSQGQVQAAGYDALKLRKDFPKQVLYSTKRLMGRSLEDLASEQAELPFELCSEKDSSQVRIKVGESKNISPIEVAAEILRCLKLRAEKSLGTPVERAVVTVPAYFDDAQRTATKAAARLAGLEVNRIVNEPTAAALAYGWNQENPGMIAVFDLGGGTFDISILKIEAQVFEVLSTNGDTHLGGDDFDSALAHWAWERAKLGAVDSAEKEKLWSDFLLESEIVKIALSKRDSTLFKVEKYSFEITRSEAEALWRPLMDKVITCCEKALKDARVSKIDLKDILLVGGSTRVPLVQKMAAEFFGREVNTNLNPDQAVALGAALQGEILMGRGGDRVLFDVLPLSLGIETVGGGVSKLIHRNSTLPTEAREVYTNHSEKQTAFDVHILQGERELVKDCRSLASFKLRGLDPAPPGYHRIEILFRIDTNGILNVRAKDLRTGKFHEVEVMPSYGLSEDELLKMLESSFDNAEQDFEARQLVEAKVEAEGVIRATDLTLKNAGHLVDEHERSLVSARLIDLKNSVSSSDHREIIKCIEELDLVSRNLAELQVNEALSKALPGKNLST